MRANDSRSSSRLYLATKAELRAPDARKRLALKSNLDRKGIDKIAFTIRISIFSFHHAFPA